MLRTSNVSTACDKLESESGLTRVLHAMTQVVGWGRIGESNKVLSDVPLVATANIVSQEECLRSNVDFFHYTNKRTFCAGNRDGEFTIYRKIHFHLNSRVFNKMRSM